MAEIQSKQFVDFTKGLNYVDPELNMDPSYLTLARNVELGYDSTVKKRNGFKLVANCLPFLREHEHIQEVFYFATYCFCYTNQGRVLSVDEDNSVYIEWDEFEAALQQTDRQSRVNIWQYPGERCFGAVAGMMYILSNGWDKPLQINFDATTRVYKDGVLTVSGNTVTMDGIEEFGVGTFGFLLEDGTFYTGRSSGVEGNVLSVEEWYTDVPEDGEYTGMLAQGSGIVNYLHDPATGSNANVPRIYKCIMVNHYLCAICLWQAEPWELNGVLIPDTSIHFSSKDAPGVWKGDDGWEEQGGADDIDVANVTQMENQELVDIDTIRGMLCVFTNFGFLLWKMDIYKNMGSSEETVTEGGVTTQVTTNKERHVPELETVVENAGALVVGSVKSIYDSLAFLSPNGINSVKRNVVSQNFVPESLSVKVLPYITDRLDNEFMEKGVTTLVDYRKFVYGLRFRDNTMLMMSFHPNLGGNKSFFIWDNIRYVSFTNNRFGKIVTTDGYGIMVYANDSDNIHQDTYVNPVTGAVQAENFEMVIQTPWLMYNASSRVKTMEYISVVSDGTARFQFGAAVDLIDETEVFIDMLGGSRKGYGSGSTLLGLITDEIYEGNPDALVIRDNDRYVGYVMANKDLPSYGNVFKNNLLVRTLDDVYVNEPVYDTDANPYYGGGIIASNLNLIDFNQVFMYNRFKIYSNDNLPLRIIRIGVQYKVGGIRR